MTSPRGHSSGADLGDNKLRHDNLWYSKPDLRGEPMSATCEGREIEIDGVTYVLNVKGES